jgi:hypothetical protein
MGKGSSGGSTGSTNIKPLPQLFSNNFGGQSIEGGLNEISQDELGYLNQTDPNGMPTLNDVANTGTNQVTQGFGQGFTSPYQMEGLSLLNELGTAPQYQSNINQANALSAYGTGQLESGYNNVAQQEAGVGTYQDQVTQAQQQVTNLENGTGLYASQQAYVDQAVNSGQAAIQQQLASEGLTSSTQNAMLKNQVAQSGAATAGQLTQGNIQLAQAGVSQAQNNVQLQQQNVALAQQGVQLAQQLTTGEQSLSSGNVSALSAMWGQVAQQEGSASTQAFQNAIGGVGLLGGFYNQIGQTYGVQMQGLQLLLQQETAQAQVNAGLQEAETQASSQGKSSMMGGLGSILGGSGGKSGGSGGLLGSIGGLFGGGAGVLSAGIGAGGAAAGAGAGVSAAVDAAGLAAVA